jgi:hypothetical protein
METLGLSGSRSEPDNIVKRLFWPGNNPSEVDSLGQQGFWVCFAVALLTLIILTYQRHWLLGIFAAFVYFLGGIGVREHSFNAAALITSAFTLDFFSIILLGRFPGFLLIFALLLLFANLRGTWIASHIYQMTEPEELPSRLNETWADKLIDQMPARVWPNARKIFYWIAGLYLALECVGIVLIAFKSHNPHL